MNRKIVNLVASIWKSKKTLSLRHFNYKYLSGNIGCDVSGRMSVCANLPADFPGDYIVIASSHLSLAPWVESHHHRLSVSSTSKVSLG